MGRGEGEGAAGPGQDSPTGALAPPLGQPLSNFVQVHLDAVFARLVRVVGFAAPISCTASVCTSSVCIASVGSTLDLLSSHASKSKLLVADRVLSRDRAGAQTGSASQMLTRHPFNSIRVRVRAPLVECSLDTPADT